MTREEIIHYLNVSEAKQTMDDDLKFWIINHIVSEYEALWEAPQSALIATLRGALDQNQLLDGDLIQAWSRLTDFFKSPANAGTELSCIIEKLLEDYFLNKAPNKMAIREKTGHFSGQKIHLLAIFAHTIKGVQSEFTLSRIVGNLLCSPVLGAKAVGDVFTRKPMGVPEQKELLCNLNRLGDDAKGLLSHSVREFLSTKEGSPSSNSSIKLRNKLLDEERTDEQLFAAIMDYIQAIGPGRDTLLNNGKKTFTHIAKEAELLLAEQDAEARAAQGPT